MKVMAPSVLSVKKYPSVNGLAPVSWLPGMNVGEPGEPMGSCSWKPERSKLAPGGLVRIETGAAVAGVGSHRAATIDGLRSAGVFMRFRGGPGVLRPRRIGGTGIRVLGETAIGVLGDPCVLAAARAPDRAPQVRRVVAARHLALGQPRSTAGDGKRRSHGGQDEGKMSAAGRQGHASCLSNGHAVADLLLHPDLSRPRLRRPGDNPRKFRRRRP